ncbi:hypothetical protein TNCV_207501 [Trichonephila clavipes]|nr:hypothetical protein TNCV_207501 [Trichonephila clavipes]
MESSGVAIYRPFGEFRRRINSYCHLYGAQGQQQSYFFLCRYEFRGPRSDYVRQSCNKKESAALLEQKVIHTITELFDLFKNQIIPYMYESSDSDLDDGNVRIYLILPNGESEIYRIPTDTRSALQLILRGNDQLTQDIIALVNRVIEVQRTDFLQCIPPHVDIFCHDLADRLAKETQNSP